MHLMSKLCRRIWNRQWKRGDARFSRWTTYNGTKTELWQLVTSGDVVTTCERWRNL